MMISYFQISTVHVTSFMYRSNVPKWVPSHEAKRSWDASASPSFRRGYDVIESRSHPSLSWGSVNVYNTHKTLHVSTHMTPICAHSPHTRMFASMSVHIIRMWCARRLLGLSFKQDTVGQQDANRVADEPSFLHLTIHVYGLETPHSQRSVRFSKTQIVSLVRSSDLHLISLRPDSHCPSPNLTQRTAHPDSLCMLLFSCLTKTVFLPRPPLQCLECPECLDNEDRLFPESAKV